MRVSVPTSGAVPTARQCAWVDRQPGGGRVDRARVIDRAAYGFIGTRGEAKVRVLGARAGGVGVLAMQQAGVGQQVGGDLTIRIVPTTELAAAVAGALPPVPSGRAASIQVSTADLKPDVHGQVSVAVSPASCNAAPSGLRS